MEHIIRFPVGDWSDDGHGKCDYFIVLSNKSVQELRELHFSIPKKLGFCIGSICRNYEEYVLSTDIFDKLQKAGFEIEWKGENDEKYFCEVDEMTMDTTNVFNLWTDILRFVDPELTLTEIKANDINFYGFDDKKRHMETPGYGVFC